MAQPDPQDSALAKAVAQHRAGRLDEAIRLYRQIVRKTPSNASAHNLLGMALNALARPADAVTHFERATALKRDFAEAHFNLGNARLTLGSSEPAAQSYQRALALRADWPEAHYNLAHALVALRRYEDAIAHYRQALALRPDYVEAHVNLGNPLQLLNRYEEAVEHYRKALVLNPGVAVARMNLASALQALNRPDEALRELDQAIALWPDYAEAKNNKSVLLLGLGRFAEAWDLYDSRWEFGGEDRRPRPYPQRRWRGERVDGALLVWGEQGLGDQILYASLLPEAAERVNSIVLEVEPRLVALMARSFPRIEVVAGGAGLYQGPVEAQTSVAGLAQQLRRSRDSFQRPERGFLVADPARAAGLRQRLAQDHDQDRPVAVGISWRSTHPLFGRSKSAQLSDFQAVSRLPGCRPVDLQYGDTRAERDEVAARCGMSVTKLDDIDNTNDIDGLAALISACDAVVTVSNTTAHLAGALGKPTWVMVPHGNARLWYWFRDRPESPWYPRVNLRFQESAETWETLVSRTAAEVAAFLGSLARR